MPTSKHSLKLFVDYVPAQLHEVKVWYISYYVKHPQSGELRLKRMKVNRIKPIMERRKFAKQLVHDINLKLANGWNPFIEQEAPKAHHKLFEVFDHFLRDKKDLRPDTLRSYRNDLKILKEWIQENNKRDMYAILFDHHMAVRLMDDLYQTRNIGSRRYNNYLVFYRLLFNWMIAHLYVKTNPFEGIKKKQEAPKKRVMDINYKTRLRIKKYLLSHHPRYYLMVLFAYHCLLRPKEIVEIRIGDIDLKKQTITVRAEVSKNKQERVAAIPDVMIEFVKNSIKDLQIARHKWYLFSNDDFKPGNKRANRRDLNRYWEGMRTKLKLDKYLQFYSLRDAGIIQMLKDGRDPKEVMEQADHSSIAVTNVYVKMARKTVSQGIIKKSNPF